MIAKIVKGTSFSGVVKYILDSAKNTEFLNSDGVRLRDIDSIVQSFVMQTELNSRVSKPVCHISLDFSAQDREKLSNELMVQIADDYMNQMGIVDTQYIIGRHHDKNHPHLHIAYNRVNNKGHTISDRNDRLRSEKICKELTTKYKLYFALGKENVKEYRLKEPDKTKYQIYNALNNNVPQCQCWIDLIDCLKHEGISVQFIYKGNTNEVQGVKFSKNNYHFNGSKVDKQFSFSKIDFQLNQNIKQYDTNSLSPKERLTSSIGQTTIQVTNNFSEILPTGYFSGNHEEEDLNLQKKKKKNYGLNI